MSEIDEMLQRLKSARERIDIAQAKILKAHGVEAMPLEPIEVQPFPVWLKFHLDQSERQAALAEYLAGALEMFNYDHDKAMEYVAGRMRGR